MLPECRRWRVSPTFRRLDLVDRVLEVFKEGETIDIRLINDHD